MASSTSTDPPGLLRLTVTATAASWTAKFREHFVVMGVGGYLLSWIAWPLLQIAVIALIYRHTRPELIGYAVIGIAAGTFIFNCQYYIGQILDEERMLGTLVNLFLAPCPRLSWLTGFALLGLAETFIPAGIILAFGILVLGVRLHPDVLSLIPALGLYLALLWGLGFVFSAVGLVLKRSNDLSNLLSPFIFLLGGIYYPMALLPLPLRIPAEALPFGYGMAALAGASLHNQDISALLPQLLPLAGFAIALPLIGVLTFRWLEHYVRVRGQLDLY